VVQKSLDTRSNMLTIERQVTYMYVCIYVLYVYIVIAVLGWEPFYVVQEPILSC